MRKEILEAIESVCAADASDISIDTDLFEEGILDSFGALELLVALGEHFGIDFDVADVTREMMSSVENIEELIARYQA